MNDCGARLVLTTTAVGPNGASLKSMVSRAIAELVPVSIVMDVVQHQLVAAAEAKLGAGRLGLKNAPAELSEALKQTFASETTVDLQQAEPLDNRAPAAIGRLAFIPGGHSPPSLSPPPSPGDLQAGNGLLA